MAAPPCTTMDLQKGTACKTDWPSSTVNYVDDIVLLNTAETIQAHNSQHWYLRKTCWYVSPTQNLLNQLFISLRWCIFCPFSEHFKNVKCFLWYINNALKWFWMCQRFTVPILWLMLPRLVSWVFAGNCIIVMQPSTTEQNTVWQERFTLTR